jgi:hypothetical protein
MDLSGGASDMCRSTSENFCCTLPSGQVATYTERVFPARKAGSNRFCVNPANVFECASNKCVPKGTSC